MTASAPKMRVALAQLSPKLRDVAANVERVREILVRHGEADLIVFPELFLSRYTTNSLDNLALDLDGPEVREISHAAREANIVVIFGMPERMAGGVANSVVCMDRRGNISASYRKTHLFGDEIDAFVTGDELAVAELDGRQAGLLICFDVEFPEVARSLALAGADYLVTISANMEPFGPDHEIFATARALENGLPHLYVNQIGRGETFTFTGGTTAISADGERLAEAGPSESVTFLDLDFSARNCAKPDHLRPDYLAQRRQPLPVTWYAARAPRAPDNSGSPKQ